MPAVYPRGPAPVPEAPPFDEPACVSGILALREARPNITKVLAAGKLIHVTGGRVPDIYRVWDEIEAERKAMDAISPADHTSASKYVTALAAAAARLDPDTWYEALKVSKGVSTWADLKAKYTVAMEV